MEEGFFEKDPMKWVQKEGGRKEEKMKCRRHKTERV